MRTTPSGMPPECSEDSLWGGRVHLFQPTTGYRFSVDSPLLVWFAMPDTPIDRCADLGAGCGVIGIGLLATGQIRSVTAVEIQPRLAKLCRRNAEHNQLSTLETVEGNLLAPHEQLPDNAFRLVVSNPPFWPVHSGKLPPDRERQLARHEIELDMDRLVCTAKRLLHPRKGRFCTAYPAERLEDLLAAITRHGMHPSRMLFVHPHAESDAELVLLETMCRKSSRTRIAPPIYLTGPNGMATVQANHILSGAFSPGWKSPS